MEMDKFKSISIGLWEGDNILRLSWMNPSEFHSSSRLTVAQTVKDKFLTFDYNWNYENKMQEGLLLIGYDAEKEIVNASWVDSWHSSAKPLALSGKIDEKGMIDLYGVYEVTNHPDWGWRIIIIVLENSLQIKMFNVSPENTEDLAVQADYIKTVA